jgi:hypothetical protein
VYKRQPAFRLGDISITRAALDYCLENKVDWHELLKRHERGDWGTVPDIIRENNFNQIQMSEQNGVGKPTVVSLYNMPVDAVMIMTNTGYTLVSLLSEIAEASSLFGQMK